MSTVHRTIYRKHWIGRTSGDRDGGYPEKRITNYTDCRGVARDFDKPLAERWELVEEVVRPMTADEVVGVVAMGRASLEAERIKAERDRDMAEFERLRRKLGK
ncbi:MAG: hypothetical protein AMXMBFR16_11430 [Candidatus Uhrbacteria bacterium]